MKKKSQFKLRFNPPRIWGGFYDPQKEEAFIFSLNITEAQKRVFIEEMEEYINHEFLHYLIQKLADINTSYKFDKVAKQVFKWDAEVYDILY